MFSEHVQTLKHINHNKQAWNLLTELVLMLADHRKPHETNLIISSKYDMLIYCPNILRWFNLYIYKNFLVLTQTQTHAHKQLAFKLHVFHYWCAWQQSKAELRHISLDFIHTRSQKEHLYRPQNSTDPTKLNRCWHLYIFNAQSISSYQCSPYIVAIDGDCGLNIYECLAKSEDLMV